MVRWQLETRPHPEQGYRSCLGLLRLGKAYGPERLEAACVRAERLGSPRYKTVKNILASGADRRLFGSEPDVVAKRIVAAVLANTPRARYPVGRGARSLVVARRLLPDAAFDYVVKGAYGVRGRSGRRRPGHAT